MRWKELKGTIADSTIISAPSSTKNKDKQRDSEHIREKRERVANQKKRTREIIRQS